MEKSKAKWKQRGCLCKVGGGQRPGGEADKWLMQRWLDQLCCMWCNQSRTPMFKNASDENEDVEMDVWAY